MELKFYSTKEPSLKPKNGHYPNVRCTHVILKKDDGTEIKAKTTCNPDDQDNKILGQKCAVRKLTQKFDDKDYRTKIWKIFKNSSKKREQIMA